MITLYDVVEYKTDIKGYWIDNNKVYVDNIRIANIKTDIRLKSEKQYLFDYKKQLAVFYIKFGKAYIESSNGDIQILKHNIQYKEKHISKDYIKALLLQHGGITIFKYKGYYIIDIWK